TRRFSNRNRAARKASGAAFIHGGIVSDRRSEWNIQDEPGIGWPGFSTLSSLSTSTANTACSEFPDRNRAEYRPVPGTDSSAVDTGESVVEYFFSGESDSAKSTLLAFLKYGRPRISGARHASSGSDPAVWTAIGDGHHEYRRNALLSR